MLLNRTYLIKWPDNSGDRRKIYVHINFIMAAAN